MRRLSVVALLALCLLSTEVSAQSNSWIPNLPPPDVYAGVDLDPFRARVSKFPKGSAFGSLTLGLNFEQKFISAESWQMPGVGGSFDPLPTNGFTALSLRVGGLLFQGRAEVYAAVPVFRMNTRYGEAGGRDIALGHFDLGGRYFPWPVEKGAVRPFVSLGFSQRRMTLSKGGDPGSDVRQLNTWTVPVGIGATFLTRFGLMVDLHARWVFGDSATLWTGVDSLALEEARTDFQQQEIDGGGFRLSLGLRWVKPLWAATGSEDFVEKTAKGLYDLKRGGVLSDLTLSLGLAMPLVMATGNYMDAFRPYLDQAYSGGPTPQIAVGWHQDNLDLEARLSFRYKYASAQGYGAGFDTTDTGLFLEVFKKFDFGFYGLVPWVGLGVGYQNTRVVDQHNGGKDTYEDGGVAFSVPFGIDFRLDPSSAWFLRSGFRWVPTSEQSLAAGATADHGGLEVEFISVVVHPQRLLQKIRGIKKPVSAVDQALGAPKNPAEQPTESKSPNSPAEQTTPQPDTAPGQSAPKAQGASPQDGVRANVDAKAKPAAASKEADPAKTSEATAKDAADSPAESQSESKTKDAKSPPAVRAKEPVAPAADTKK